MLWDLIREFFVVHVFGGTLQSDNGIQYYNGAIGQLTNGSPNGDANYYNANLTNVMMPLKVFSSDGEEILNYISLGDWLSTSATIISITIIVVLCCMFVYKIIRLIGGLIR